MKTVTITLHDTENCGSSLQAFALQYYLKECGIENELIHYVPAYTQNGGYPIRAFVRNVIYFKATLLRKKKFQKFICDHLILTKQKYTSLKQLRQNPPVADCYISGSDQLWNTMFPCGYDPAFYLDFVKGRKITYAVSLGREKIPKDNLDIIQRHIADFSAVSVREVSSVKQIENLYGKEVAYVCDPVLLNPPSAYDSIKAERMIREPYILVYIAQEIDLAVLNQWIGKVNPTDSKAIVFIGSYRQKCQCDYHIRDFSPGDFLSLIYYADYVISNSFHATLFSLLYQKQFTTIVPSENGARIRSILSDMGLKHHAVTFEDALPNDISTESYTDVRNVLEQFRLASQKWLKNALLLNRNKNN